MSNFLAVATVTAALQRTLQSAVQDDVGGATVTTVRPAEGQNTDLPTTGVNLFLYQVVANPHWRNGDLPTRRADGELAQRPQAALDLRYLLSFYGSELSLEPQRLLGSTVAFLDSQPILTRAEIDAVVGDNNKPYLQDSDLSSQIDVVRYTPVALSLEEMARLWSVFFQVSYVLSIAYQASVVLVEPDATPRPAVPARTYDLTAVPLQQPFISRVVSTSGETAPILPGSTIRIEGDDLRADVMRVEIDGDAVATTSVGASRIELALPAALLPAGPHAVQVRHGIAIGAENVDHMALSSNLAGFVLHPTIDKPNGGYDIVISNVQGAGGEPRSATVDVAVHPDVTAQQTATLELLTGQGVAYTFIAKELAAASATLTFAAHGVTAGDYFVRVRVDGAESPLELDADRAPVAPLETIP